MGRPAVIRQVIISILRNSEFPLRFSEIKQKVEELLNKKVHDKSIAENLSRLIQNGIVEKVIEGTHVAYRLTNNYFAAQIKSTVHSIISKISDPMYADLEDESYLPYLAFIQKTKKPELNKGTIFFWPESGMVEWDDPKAVIVLRMLETVNELDTEVKEGIVTFLARAYWCGTRTMIKKYGIAPLSEVISKNKDFASQCLKRATEEWKDVKRAKAEKAILSILNITSELITKPNLKEFLLFLWENSFKVKMLQREVLHNIGHYMSTGEKIFDSFLDFHKVVCSGLYAAGLTPVGRRRGSYRFKERHFYSYSNIWSDFIQRLLWLFIDRFRNINGEMEEEIPKIRAISRYLDYIKQLPFQSKVVITYLWGYPEIFLASDKSFLPWFEDWFQALKQGNLDHRVWIFENIEKVRRAYRAVKMGREPSPDLLDLDVGLWTLRDLYLYHPRGRDLDFWEELLNELNARAEFTRAYRSIKEDEGSAAH